MRSRGPQPTLSDAEVLTIEVVGEFLGIDTDSGLYRYFRRHFGDWFPDLMEIHRTTFLRQAANLWFVKRELWQELLKQVPQDSLITVFDCFPVPVCRFARAPRCQGFTKARRHLVMMKWHARPIMASVLICVSVGLA